MAVSNQWFIQWLQPSTIFSDISSQYRNPHWGSSRPSWSDNPYDVYTSPDTTYTKLIDNNYNIQSRKLEKNKNTNRGQTASIALWLTLMGSARSQAVPADTDTPPFSTLYKWKEIDFEFPSQWHRNRALATGKYVPGHIAPLALEVWGSRVWVTLPNWRSGIPVTLATVPRFGGLTSPTLKPYPNWNFHKGLKEYYNCSGLTSVFRINIDPCGRLWVIDSGLVNSQDVPQQVCPPAVVVFDLQTDNLIARYEIPKKYVLQDSLFSNIITDARTSDCSDLHAYITDTWRYGLIVFRERDHEFWKFFSPTFFPDPLASNYSLHGLNFQWTDGILGLALSPANSYNERMLFFHSMSSFYQFSVRTSVLQQPSRINDTMSEFNLVGESRGPFGHSSASAMDKRGVIFYGFVTRDSIGCWDTRKPYHPRSIGVVAKNSETLVFPNDVKVDKSERQSLWIVSTRLPMFQKELLDPDDYNFRIMYADTIEAVRGTVCDPEMQAPLSVSTAHKGWLP